MPQIPKEFPHRNLYICRKLTIMSMNKKQVAQTVIAAIAAILILFWIFSPGGMSTSGRILGIVGNALLIASMIISYFAEEKKKKN